MQILVTADTHLTDPSELPPELINVANSSEMILHAGDFISSDIYDFLDGLGNLIAVRGNSDEAALRGRLPLKQVIEIDGVKVEEGEIIAIRDSDASGNWCWQLQAWKSLCWACSPAAI